MFGKDKKEKELKKFDAEYMGGHKFYPKKKDTDVLVYEDRILIKKLELTIPFAQINNIENMDEKRITKTRIFLTGFIVGLLWKKKFLYTVIDYNDGMMDQSVVIDFHKDIQKAQQMIYEGMVNSRVLA